MRPNRRCLFIAITLLLISSVAQAGVLEKKTINRWVDPVTLKGDLAREVLGKPIANLRIYACKNGAMQPIRYQIDEMTKEGGDFVLTSGPITNPEMGNNKLDTWDLICFMADDTGDKVSKEDWTQGSTVGTEIEIIDPLTGDKGWCYLLYFTSNAPARSSEPDYVRYDYNTGTFCTDYRCDQTIITPEGKHTVFFNKGWTPKGAGGNEQNCVDRIKSRLTIKLLFGSLTLRVHEETMMSEIIGYRVGPIRMIKRAEQYIQMPKWAGGGKAMRAIMDDMNYRNTGTVPVTVEIPFKMDTVATSAKIWVGIDHNSTTIGSKVLNSENPQGFLIDGKMDDGELDFHPGVDKWRIFTGPFQTSMQRTIFTQKLLDEDIKIKFGIIDDAKYKNPPESEPGTYGCIWQEWDMTKVKGGKYILFLEFYTIPWYKHGDEKEYTKYMDQPIKIRTGVTERFNYILILPEICEKYKKPPKGMKVQ